MSVQLHAVLLTCHCYRCVHLLQVKRFRHTHSALLALALTGAGCVLLLLVFLACLPCCSSAIVWRPRLAVPAHLVPCLFISMHASAQSVTRGCMGVFACGVLLRCLLHASAARLTGLCICLQAMTPGCHCCTTVLPAGSLLVYPCRQQCALSAVALCVSALLVWPTQMVRPDAMPPHGMLCDVRATHAMLHERAKLHV